MQVDPHGNLRHVFLGQVRTVLNTDLEALITLYASCFAEAPWYELFPPESVREDFLHAQSLRESIFLTAMFDGRVIGGAIGFPVVEKEEVYTLLPAEDRAGFYMAELFVDARFRRSNAGFALTVARMAFAHTRGYRRFIVRTSAQQSAIIDMYQRWFGAHIVTRQQVTSQKVIDGKIVEAPDERVILAGNISAP